jgi:hypothetical protein
MLGFAGRFSCSVAILFVGRRFILPYEFLKNRPPTAVGSLRFCRRQLHDSAKLDQCSRGDCSVGETSRIPRDMRRLTQ